MQTRPPSILILNRVFPPYSGATGRMACDLALHFRKQGHHVTVVSSAPEPKMDTAKNLSVIRVQGDKMPQGAVQYFRILKRMYKAAVRLQRHDFVISMTDPPLLARYGHKVARKMGAKHIHWAQDVYPDLFPIIEKPLGKFAYNYIEGKTHHALKAAHGIVAIGKCMAKCMTHKSIPRRTMHVIENWPEADLMGGDQEVESSLFKDDAQKFRVLYAGNIGLAHDFTAIMKVAAYCQKKHPEIEFVFVGKGRGLDALARTKAQAGLDNVRFLPPQPQKSVKGMMQAGDVHLVTMKERAAGLMVPCKFYSSCAVGRPVIYIGPEASDIHSMINHHQCGVSLRNNDHQGLARAILDYRRDGEKWFAACQAAKTVVQGAPANRFKQWDDLIASFA